MSEEKGTEEGSSGDVISDFTLGIDEELRLEVEGKNQTLQVVVSG